MRNPLLVFFSGYNLNRYFIKLKFPRDIAVIAALKRETSLRAGTCPWRGLYSNWNLTTEATTLLDFSRVKQYRLGFDSVLSKVKSPSELKRLKHVRFDVDYQKLVSKHIFCGFFFNHGVYGSTSNHNLPMWRLAYQQLITLDAILRINRRRGNVSVAAFSGSNLSGGWRHMLAHGMLSWSLCVSQKFYGYSGRRYLDDVLTAEYHDLYSVNLPWEQLRITKELSENFLIGLTEPRYVLPEFYGNREVTVSSKFSNVSGTSELPYSEFFVAQLIEDGYYRVSATSLRSSYTERSVSFRMLLLYLALCSEGESV